MIEGASRLLEVLDNAEVLFRQWIRIGQEVDTLLNLPSLWG